MSGVTLDAGALIALDKGDRRMLVLLERARETGARVTVPASALAQAVRRPRTQVALMRLVRQPTTDVRALDGPDATGIGMLLALRRTTDIADAHVILCGKRSKQPIVTSDPHDLRHLDADVTLIVL